MRRGPRPGAEAITTSDCRTANSQPWLIRSRLTYDDRRRSKVGRAWARQRLPSSGGLESEGVHPMPTLSDSMIVPTIPVTDLARARAF